MWLGSAVILAALMLLFRRLEKLLGLKGRLWGLLRGTVTVAVALGSTNLFLVMESKVYQEAIMWGSALALAHAVCLVCFLLEPRGKWLALACAAAFLSFFARVSSGAGTLLALAIVDLCPGDSIRPFSEILGRAGAGLETPRGGRTDGYAGGERRSVGGIELLEIRHLVHVAGRWASR